MLITRMPSFEDSAVLVKSQPRTHVLAPRYLRRTICAALFAPHYLRRTICAALFAPHYLRRTICAALFAPHYLRRTICAALFAPHYLRRTICVLKHNKIVAVLVPNLIEDRDIHLLIYHQHGISIYKLQYVASV